MAGGPALQFGDWVWAAFPIMARKTRPGVYVATFETPAGALAAVIPATAEKGHRPGAFAIADPPAEGLRDCRLIVGEICLLRQDRLRPLGAGLTAELQTSLSGLIAERLGEDWRRTAAQARGPGRLKGKSCAARRREKRR